MAENKISIIIPILNEAENITVLLEHLRSNSSINNISEVIVVDGGSTDESVAIISSFKSNSKHQPLSKKEQNNIIQINAIKGRAKQMNTGAKIATANILYFLHADSFPPKDFDQLIINEVEKNNNAGCFRMQFNSKHWWLLLASWLTKFSWRASRGGDQSQFITKSLFNDIGGFDETYTIYEDNILINELYKRKEFTVIQHKIRTSARLYETHGVWKLQYHFWTIYVKKWFGASAEELYNYYLKYIAQKQ